YELDLRGQAEFQRLVRRLIRLASEPRARRGSGHEEGRILVRVEPGRQGEPAIVPGPGTRQRSEIVAARTVLSARLDAPAFGPPPPDEGSAGRRVALGIADDSLRRIVLGKISGMPFARCRRFRVRRMGPFCAPLLSCRCGLSLNRWFPRQDLVRQ